MLPGEAWKPRDGRRVGRRIRHLDRANLVRRSLRILDVVEDLARWSLISCGRPPSQAAGPDRLRLDFISRLDPLLEPEVSLDEDSLDDTSPSSRHGFSVSTIPVSRRSCCATESSANGSRCSTAFFTCGSRCSTTFFSHGNHFSTVFFFAP
ncbi:hypothetical protein PF003_g24733 [Phytophthora fragariae]|nr:hypothetical protein PF003_g24733 [Phytophthora fragariae]